MNRREAIKQMASAIPIAAGLSALPETRVITGPTISYRDITAVYYVPPLTTEQIAKITAEFDRAKRTGGYIVMPSDGPTFEYIEPTQDPEQAAYDRQLYVEQRIRCQSPPSV